MCGDSARLSVCLEILAATNVLQISVVHGEVGGEHGCCDFATVIAIAKKCVDKAGSLYRLRNPMLAKNRGSANLGRSWSWRVRLAAILI